MAASGGKRRFFSGLLIFLTGFSAGTIASALLAITINEIPLPFIKPPTRDHHETADPSGEPRQKVDFPRHPPQTAPLRTNNPTNPSPSHHRNPPPPPPLKSEPVISSTTYKSAPFATPPLPTTFAAKSSSAATLQKSTLAS